MDKSPKPSFTGLILAIGLVFGDIGTSPLYVLRACVVGRPITEELVLGCLSLIFWTLTLMVSVKYVGFVLKADNEGEGGILALYNLVRRKKKWALFIALAGFAGLMAEALITPAISVMAAVEGLNKIHPGFNSTILAVIILLVLFLGQFAGSSVLGKGFGSVMLVWFLVLAILGIFHIYKLPMVFLAVNPLYGLRLIMDEPRVFAIIGAVFLCITGVEALYSDLGHAGRTNIRVAWSFVKLTLLLNYFGQGAYLLEHLNGQILPNDFSVFYELFPSTLLPYAIILSTISTIIASQAVISGLFSLVASAISLNLLPKFFIKYPGDVKGQVLIPVVNSILGAGCILVTIHFQNSWNLEHAYGLSVNITLLCTSLLYILFVDRSNMPQAVKLVFLIYLLIETVFLKANLSKFFDGAYFTVIVGVAGYLVLYSWHYGYKLLRDLREFVEIKPFLPKLSALSEDRSIPIFCDNLVYLTESSIPELIESRIMYSVFRKRPKRALTYFFVHLQVTDRPLQEDVKVTCFERGKIYRLDFLIGFKNRPNLQSRFNNAYEDLVAKGEIEDLSSAESLRQYGVPRSTVFVALSKMPFIEKELSFWEQILVGIWSFLRSRSLPKWRSFDLDESLIFEEKVPAFAKLSARETIKRLV